MCKATTDVRGESKKIIYEYQDTKVQSRPERLEYKLKIKRINETSVEELEKWVHNNVSNEKPSSIANLRKKNRSEEMFIFLRGRSSKSSGKPLNKLHSPPNVNQEQTDMELITLEMPKDVIIKVKSESSPKGELEERLDSGTHISVAKESTIEPCQYQRNNRKTLTDFGGERQTSQGETNLNIKIEDKDVTWPLQDLKSLGVTRANATLGGDSMEKGTVQDFINGKLMFVAASGQNRHFTNEEQIYALCGEDKATELIENNNESLSIKVNGDRVEIAPTRHERFPPKNMQGLSDFEELKSVPHSVMSTPAFMRFINERLSKRSGIVQMIEPDYHQNRRSQNRIWEPGGVDRTFGKTQPFDHVNWPIKVDGDRIEITTTPNELFPTKGMQVLSDFEKLKWLWHLVVSIPAFMSFMNGIMSICSSTIQMIDQTYQQTRRSQNRVWEPGGVDRTFGKIQTFERKRVQLNERIMMSVMVR